MKNLFSRLHFDTLLLLFVLALMVGLLMLQANPLTTFPSRDSGFFMYAGKQILAGKLPYIDFWDSKGPAIFYLNALGLFIGKGYRWGVWLLEYFLLGISSYLFYKSTAQKWGRGAALLSSATWLYGLYRVWEGGNLTEEYSLFFSFILLSYFLKTDEKPDKKLSLFIGATFALSFSFRANNTGVQIAILLSLLLSCLWHRKYRQLIEILGFAIISGVAVLSLVSVYFLKIGIFSDMFEAAILYNFFYSGTGNCFHLNFWQGIKQIGLPAYIGLSGYLAIGYQIIRKKADSSSSALKLFLLIGLPLEVFLSSLSGKNYLHYFISWIPIIAVLVAFAYARFAKNIFSSQFVENLNHRYKSLLLAACVLFFVYGITGSGKEYQDTAKRILFERGKGIEQIDPVAEFLRANTTQDDFILAWGAYPGLNFLAKRNAPTPYLFYPAYEVSPYLEKMDISFWQDISTTPPKIIVDAYSVSSDYIFSLDPLVRQHQLQYASARIYQPPYQDQVFAFVEENYQCVDTINGFDIYLLIPIED